MHPNQDNPLLPNASQFHLQSTGQHWPVDNPHFSIADAELEREMEQISKASRSWLSWGLEGT